MQNMSVPMGLPVYPICPITTDVMMDPVIDHEGNTYERSAILSWLKINNTSPVTRNPLRVDQLIPNRAILQYSVNMVNIVQENITNCSNCKKPIKVTKYKGHKELLCYKCRDWECKVCTLINKCTSNACEACEGIR